MLYEVITCRTEFIECDRFTSGHADTEDYSVGPVNIRAVCANKPNEAPRDADRPTSDPTASGHTDTTSCRNCTTSSRSTQHSHFSRTARRREQTTGNHRTSSRASTAGCRD